MVLSKNVIWPLYFSFEFYHAKIDKNLEKNFKNSKLYSAPGRKEKRSINCYNSLFSINLFRITNQYMIIIWIWIKLLEGIQGPFFGHGPTSCGPWIFVPMPSCLTCPNLDNVMKKLNSLVFFIFGEVIRTVNKPS